MHARVYAACVDAAAYEFSDERIYMVDIHSKDERGPPMGISFAEPGPDNQLGNSWAVDDLCERGDVKVGPGGCNLGQVELRLDGREPQRA